MRLGSYVAFGVGALGVGAGTFFLVRSASKRSDADKAFEECGGATRCSNDNPLSRQVTALDDSARSAQTIGVVGLAAGGVGVAAGVVLFVLSGGEKRPSTGLSVVPRIGIGSIGAGGSF
jgi:hypothetical protein